MILLMLNYFIYGKVIALNPKAYGDKYLEMTKPIRESRNGIKIIRILDKLTTSTVYLAYIIFLMVLFFNSHARLLRAVISPGVSFVVLSVFRSYNNAPRPYEAFDIEPIIVKNTKGESFPSRHVFSAFIIATTIYFVSMPVGIALLTIGAIIAIVRVIGGVHFPRDVIAGAVIGIVFGIIGWKLKI